MYNETIKFIKNYYIKYKKTILDYKKIRTYHLKNIRDKIITRSSIDTKKRIKTHIIDCAIKLACSNYKSALSNLKNKNANKKDTKSFRALHKCSQKTDKTTVGYWSCNVGRYAKQLGLSSSNS